MFQERLEPHVVAVLPIPFELNLIAAMASLPRPSSHDSQLSHADTLTSPTRSLNHKDNTQKRTKRRALKRRDYLVIYRHTPPSHQPHKFLFAYKNVGIKSAAGNRSLIPVFNQQFPPLTS